MRTRAARERDARARYALTFGLEADAVRAAHCVAERETTDVDGRCRCVCRTKLVDFELMTVRDPAHIISVGAGGGRFDLVALCSAHHGQQHSMGIDSFAELYGLDRRALADEQALAHEPPLGIRGLAARFSAERDLDGLDAGMSSEFASESAIIVRDHGLLAGYDLDALLGWVRRRMASESMSCREQGCDPTQDWNAMVGSIQTDLGWQYHAGDGPCFETAVDLCELAGWPS